MDVEELRLCTDQTHCCYKIVVSVVASRRAVSLTACPGTKLQSARMFVRNEMISILIITMSCCLLSKMVELY